MEGEQLDASPFFLELKTRCKKLFDKASKEGWTICIPRQRAVIVPVKMLDTSVLAEHILQPSPFLRDQYLTGKGRTVLRPDPAHLTTSTGFAYSKTVKVLGEETFLTSDYVPYTVLCIDYRLDVEKNELLDSHVFTLPTEDASDLHLRVLESTPGTEKALLAAKAEASAFMHSYVMLKGYETNTREKVEASAERLLSALVRISPPLRRCHEDSASTVRLRQVVENVYIGFIASYLTSNLERMFLSEDSSLAALIDRHAPDVSLASLQVREELRAPLALSEAISTYQSGMPAAVTPLDKCRVIQRTLQSMETGYQQHVAGCGIAKDVTVATDDLIPIVAYILVMSKQYRHLASLTVYLNEFLLSSVELPAISFLAVTFQAVVEYIKQGGLSSNGSREAPPVEAAPVAESAHRPSQKEKSPPPQPAIVLGRPDEQQGGLGDFLSQLQQSSDTMSSRSYGARW